MAIKYFFQEKNVIILNVDSRYCSMVNSVRTDLFICKMTLIKIKKRFASDDNKDGDTHDVLMRMRFIGDISTSFCFCFDRLRL